jgi:hypothetical protein
MLPMSNDMVAKLEAQGAIRRPPDMAKAVAESTQALLAGMEKASCAICEVGSKVEAAGAQIGAASSKQAAASSEILATVLETASKKSAYVFEVKRDRNGLMESVIARPCE